MKLLLDTHLLLMAAGHPERMPAIARSLFDDPRNELFFSAASLWEIALKQRQQGLDLRVDARLLRRGLVDNGYQELAVSGAHAVAVDALPPHHDDPFDRLLVAQAIAEGILLLTTDPRVAQYLGPVRLI